MAHRITIIGFSLSLQGLKIIYQKEDQANSIQYDPCAACDFFKTAGLIEDFTTDPNGEPIILYTDQDEYHGYGYELWHRFVKSFYLTRRMVELLIEGKESQKQFLRTIATINYLLTPLSSVA